MAIRQRKTRKAKRGDCITERRDWSAESLSKTVTEVPTGFAARRF